VNRKLTKTVVITGRTTDNPNFQWYEIGEKFEVVETTGFRSENGEINWYRCVDKDFSSLLFFGDLLLPRKLYPVGLDRYISKEDCLEISDFRDSKLKELGIDENG